MSNPDSNKNQQLSNFGEFFQSSHQKSVGDLFDEGLEAIVHSSSRQISHRQTNPMMTQIPQSSQVFPNPTQFSGVPNNDIGDQCPFSEDPMFGFRDAKDDYSLFCILDSASKICSNKGSSSGKNASAVSICESIENSVATVVTIGAGTGSSAGGHFRVPQIGVNQHNLNDPKKQALIGFHGTSFNMESAPSSRSQPHSPALLKRTFGSYSDGDAASDDIECHHDSNCSGIGCGAWTRRMNSKAAKLSTQQNSINIRSDGIMPANMGMINQQQGQENILKTLPAGGGYNFQPIRSNAPESNMYSNGRYMQTQQQFGTNFQTPANIKNTNYYQYLLGVGSQYQAHNTEVIDVEEYETKKLVAAAAAHQAGDNIIDVEEKTDTAGMENTGTTGTENTGDYIIAGAGGADHATDEEKKLENIGTSGMEPEITALMDNLPDTYFEVRNEAFPNWPEEDLMTTDRFGFRI